MKTAIRAGQLKHVGVIKEASYTITGQPGDYITLFSSRFGIDKEAVSKVDEENNTGNKKSLSLFARYNNKIQNGQALFIFGNLYKISELDNEGFENRRLNLTITQI
ncbi:MAG TPA: hypothetical protein EYN67_19315 [Flavobacteriales bacterium]|nr:hypothetical protein [Methylococcaceae bacterium]HHZ97637.1 hypothetical protein [Flavobacteriales bacterium]